MADGKIDPGAYERASTAAKKLLTTQQGITKATAAFEANFNSITSLFTDVSGSEFFDKVAKTPQDIQDQIGMWQQLKGEIASAAKEINQGLGDAYDNFAQKYDTQLKAIDAGALSIADRMKESIGGAMDSISDAQMQKLYQAAQMTTGSMEAIKNELTTQGISLGENEEIVNKIKIGYEDIAEQNDLNKKALEDILEDHEGLKSIIDDELRAKTAIALKNREMPALLEKVSSIEREQILAAIDQQNTALGEQMRDYTDLVGKSKEFEQNMQETNKSVFSLGKGLKAIGKNLQKQIIDKMFEFDTMLHKVQQNTGIDMVNNAAKMTELTVKSAEFGMTVEQTGDMMERLSDELRSVDFDLIAGAAEDFVAISKATGASSESVTIIAGEMMRAGASSKDVKDAMAGANVEAKRFGVSTKKVIESLSRNLEKMRTFGFTGGVESLAKMTAMAERLRFEVDEIFNVAKKARQIEGAMEMAAELQLAGGSFANINPMDLLASARKGPEELGKILTSMGEDVGRFNKETGQYEFDAVDIDRLQIVSEATGMELDSLQKMIQKNAEDNKKLSAFPEEMFNIDGLDPDAVKAQISDAMEFDTEKGEWVIKGDNMFGAKSISDLQNLTDTQIKSAMDEQEVEAKRLEDQARENTDFKQSLKAFTESLINLFTIFQPVLEALGWVVQQLTSVLKTDVGMWIGGLTVALLLLAKSKAIGKIASGVSGLAKGISSLGSGGLMGKIGAGAKSTFIEKGAKTGGASVIADTAQKTKKVSAGTGLRQFMQNLAAGLKSFGKNSGQILKGAATFALTLLMVGGSLALIAAAFGAMGGDPLILLAMAAAIVGLAFSFSIMSKAAKGIKMDSVMKMSLAMLVMGAALIPFSIAALIMSGVDWGKVLAGIVVLTAVIFGLMGLGFLFMNPLLGVALLIGIGILVSVAFGLLMFGGAMLMLATALQKIQGVDVSNIAGIAMGLLDLIPALLGLALAGLMFANPLILLGFERMLMSLMALSFVLIPLSEALSMGAEALDKMASGVLKLGDALSKFDVEKMRELGEISKNMAAASSDSKMAEAMAQFAKALRGGGGGAPGGGGSGKGTGEKITVQVQLVMPNGRVLKEQEVKDIEIVS